MLDRMKVRLRGVFVAFPLMLLATARIVWDYLADLTMEVREEAEWSFCGCTFGELCSIFWNEREDEPTVRRLCGVFWEHAKYGRRYR